MSEQAIYINNKRIKFKYSYNFGYSVICENNNRYYTFFFNQKIESNAKMLMLLFKNLLYNQNDFFVYSDNLIRTSISADRIVYNNLLLESYKIKKDLEYEYLICTFKLTNKKELKLVIRDKIKLKALDKYNSDTLDIDYIENIK